MAQPKVYHDADQLYKDDLAYVQNLAQEGKDKGYKRAVNKSESVTDTQQPDTWAVLELPDGTKQYHNRGDDIRYVKAGTSGADEDLLHREGYNEIQDLKKQWEALNAQGLGTSPEAMALHQRAEEIRAGAGYSGGMDGSKYITLGSLGLAGPGGATLPGGMGQMPGGVPSVGNSQQALLNEWQKAAGQQATGQIDYAVNRGVTELERALADAQPMFKEQAEAVARDEMQALDNSALYAEARGDKGGIGHSQYNEIQSAAAQNRLAVQQAQTKLATDTARQIADLRAQGEFEKADKLLEITQSYLSQLMNLEKWSAEFGLSVEQFQANLDKWQKEFDFERYKYDTNLGLNKTSQMADLASALLGSGIRLDKAQMDALGISEDQMNEMLLLNQLQATQTPTMSLTTAKDAAKNGVLSDEVLSVLYQNGYTDEMIRKIYSHMEMPANASNDLKRLVDMVKSKKFDSAEKAIEFAVGIQNNSSYKNAITDDELNWFAEWLDVQKWED